MDVPFGQSPPKGAVPVPGSRTSRFGGESWLGGVPPPLRSVPSNVYCQLGAAVSASVLTAVTFNDTEVDVGVRGHPEPRHAVVAPAAETWVPMVRSLLNGLSPTWLLLRQYRRSN